MKRKIAVFMIVNLLMAFFTVINLKDVSAEQETCCVMENSCGLMNAAECSAGGFRDSGVISCNSVPECSTGCCVTANSCDNGRTNTWCNQNGVSWSSGDCSGKSECSTGVCIINGICYDNYKKRQCDAAGLGAKFDSSIQDCVSANIANSGSEGCCITGNNYIRTTQSACNGGRFISGYLCSSAVTGSNCLPRDHKTCFNGKVYWVDSCGNKENVADDLAEHTTYNQANSRILSDSVLKNNIGYCKIEDGKSCGVDNKGRVACLDMNCDLGESFYIETNFDPEIAMFLDTKSIKIDQKFLGETSEQQKGNRRFIYDQKVPSKENTEIRKDGESWCMLWPQPEQDSPAAPGSRDYVFRCVKGKIEIESCDDYRSEVCSEGYDDTGGITTARCGDNKWEGCIGANQKRCDDKNKLCSWVKGECVPLTPPGNVFWSDDTSKGNEYKCEKCGSGWRNRCNEESCVRLGDCRITKISIWSRIGKIALLVAITVATMASFGIGFGYTAVPAGTSVTQTAAGTYVTTTGVTLPATTAVTAVESGAWAGTMVTSYSASVATGFLSAVPGIDYIASAGYWAGDKIGLTKIFGAGSAAKTVNSKTQSPAANPTPRVSESLVKRSALNIGEGMITNEIYQQLGPEEQSNYIKGDNGNYYPNTQQTQTPSGKKCVNPSTDCPKNEFTSERTCNSRFQGSPPMQTKQFYVEAWVNDYACENGECKIIGSSGGFIVQPCANGCSDGKCTDSLK